MVSYPPEFKADAVALYESRPEATIRSVTAELGINPEARRSPGRLGLRLCHGEGVRVLPGVVVRFDVLVQRQRPVRGAEGENR
ncbi:hypothetical protein, partial [Streptomyces sp. CAI-78]|uniref:hypothetical protein n=1 Tax=Streptomyces sp. CAI-78 TaxID=1169746 RepID=UPI001C312C8C